MFNKHDPFGDEPRADVDLHCTDITGIRRKFTQDYRTDVVVHTNLKSQLGTRFTGAKVYLDTHASKTLSHSDRQDIERHVGLVQLVTTNWILFYSDECASMMRTLLINGAYPKMKLRKGYRRGDNDDVQDVVALTGSKLVMGNWLTEKVRQERLYHSTHFADHEIFEVCGEISGDGYTPNRQDGDYGAPPTAPPADNITLIVELKTRMIVIRYTKDYVMFKMEIPFSHLSQNSKKKSALFTSTKYPVTQRPDAQRPDAQRRLLVLRLRMAPRIYRNAPLTDAHDFVVDINRTGLDWGLPLLEACRSSLSDPRNYWIRITAGDYGCATVKPGPHDDLKPLANCWTLALECTADNVSNCPRVALHAVQ
eukprot:Lankesteria_metandrocarpae@DN9443_c0_g1_i1.p1